MQSNYQHWSQILLFINSYIIQRNILVWQRAISTGINGLPLMMRRSPPVFFADKRLSTNDKIKYYMEGISWGLETEAPVNQGGFECTHSQFHSSLMSRIYTLTNKTFTHEKGQPHVRLWQKSFCTNESYILIPLHIQPHSLISTGFWLCYGVWLALWMLDTSPAYQYCALYLEWFIIIIKGSPLIGFPLCLLSFLHLGQFN